MFRLTKLNWHEPFAYGVAFVALSIGTIFAIFDHTDAMGMAGSVVSVCGVLLASSRKIDNLHAKAIAFMESRREDEREVIRKTLTTPAGRLPNDKDVDDVFNAVFKDGRTIVDELIEERRRVFKFHEIFLVTAGTLVNGFGAVLAKVISGLVA